MQVLFFGQLREALGTANLKIDSRVETVQDLKQLLGEKGDVWQEYLFKHSCLCAVNQVLAQDTHALKEGDEVAFFPPVTGG